MKRIAFVALVATLFTLEPIFANASEDTQIRVPLPTNLLTTANWPGSEIAKLFRRQIGKQKFDSLQMEIDSDYSLAPGKPQNISLSIILLDINLINGTFAECLKTHVSPEHTYSELVFEKINVRNGDNAGFCSNLTIRVENLFRNIFTDMLLNQQKKL